MLSKCANPTCSTPLIYLREGKIFMMENAGEPQTASRVPVLAKPQPIHRVEHFWLCGPCSVEMTLIYDHAKRVVVVPKVKKRAVAAAS